MIIMKMRPDGRAPARAIAAVLIAVIVLICVMAAAALLYRHFITDRIMDGGDMTNPFTESSSDDAGENAVRISER